MAGSTDYTGRTIDLLIFQGVAESGDQRIETGFGEAGMVCTAVQKVAQTWAVLFLTERGTVLNDPTRGSSFLTNLRRGRIQVQGDIPAEFSAAADQVRRTMELDAAKDGTLPTDERLASAQLLSYTLDRGQMQLYLRVRIRTVAGDARTIYLPVSVPII